MSSLYDKVTFVTIHGHLHFVNWFFPSEKRTRTECFPMVNLKTYKRRRWKVKCANAYIWCAYLLHPASQISNHVRWHERNVNYIEICNIKGWLCVFWNILCYNDLIFETIGTNAQYTIFARKLLHFFFFLGSRKH